MSEKKDKWRTPTNFATTHLTLMDMDSRANEISNDNDMHIYIFSFSTRISFSDWYMICLCVHASICLCVHFIIISITETKCMINGNTEGCNVGQFRCTLIQEEPQIAYIYSKNSGDKCIIIINYVYMSNPSITKSNDL